MSHRISAPSLPPRFPAQLDIPLELAVALMEAAVKSVRQSARETMRSRRPRRGETLKPGSETPLWNELAAAVRAQLTRRGEKTKLGRVLRLPRQRINDLLRRKHHLPDAERTLLLLVWLHVRRGGGDLC